MLKDNFPLRCFGNINTSVFRAGNVHEAVSVIAANIKGDE
jgi:hypothetical protein